MTEPKTRPNQSRRLLAGGLLLLGIGWAIGHFSSATLLTAQNKTTPIPASTGNRTTEKTQRVVAYIHGQPVTREEFGDYLIDLYGAERIDLFVNKRIIEMHCAKVGIEVTPEEIDAAILEDCKRINVSKADYVRTVLKQRYGKTLDEWRNDVMKPRLLLAKICRDNVPVEDKELQQMFENRYGQKVRCKIIIWPLEEAHLAQKVYGELRKGDAEFDSIARKQKDANLASRNGEIDPIGRHSGPESAKVEEIAFKLKVGEVSGIIELPIGVLVIKNIGFIDPVQGAEFEKLKPELRKEVVERKLEKEIPKLFAKLREDAKPVLLPVGHQKVPPATEKP